MPPSPDSLHLEPEDYRDPLRRLKQIYAAMDRAYTRVADRYGFHCNGCEDNCCLTHFHHHTFLEFLYLLKGYRSLERRERIDIRDKADAVCTALSHAQTGKGDQPPRLMCPLNSDGRCRLYRKRPMICRMHGLPHLLRRPDGRIVKGPGCKDFESHCRDKAPVAFDRTPFYRDMARLEGELRQLIGAETRIKMTVAEMILAFWCAEKIEGKDR